jgi:hypothetical protein
MKHGEKSSIFPCRNKVVNQQDYIAKLYKKTNKVFIYLITYLAYITLFHIINVIAIYLLPIYKACCIIKISLFQMYLQINVNKNNSHKISYINQFLYPSIMNYLLFQILYHI